MPKVIIYYFELKALGEGIRLLLAYGGEEFEDRRITREEWPEFKKSTPFGQLPNLEIDGKKKAQTLAILRYLGRKYGVAGKNIEEDFEIDQIADFFTDFHFKAADLYHETDEKRKVKMQEELENNYYPFALKKLNDTIIKNNGYLALGKLTWVDFLFAGMYDCLRVTMPMPDLGEKYPELKKLRDFVYSIPQVKAFSDKTPYTEW